MKSKHTTGPDMDFDALFGGWAENVARIQLTPVLAGDLLGRNNENRSISSRWVRELADRMSRGEWLYNGDPIRIDTGGRLIDGQHRCLAVIESGVTADTLLIRDLDPGTFLTIDIGKRRTIADHLAIAGYTNTTLLAGAIGWYYRLALMRTMTSTVRPSPAQAREILEQAPGLASSATLIANIHPPGSQVLYACLHYMFAEKGGDGAATEFWRRVADGIGLDANDPEYLLRERFYDSARSTRKMRLVDSVYLSIRAWNARCLNERLAKLQLPSNLDRDARGVEAPRLLEIKSPVS